MGQHKNIAIFALVGVSIVAYAVFCLLPIADSNVWFDSHEEQRYLALLHHFKAAFEAGNLYPRWLPELYAGYGYPTFVFYQPGVFYLALVFSYLPIGLLSAWKVTIGIIFVLGATGAFFLVRRLSNWQTGLFGALWFVLTPYFFVNLYVRGDLSELCAMALCPWPLYFLVSLRESLGTRSTAPPAFCGLVLSLVAVIATHPLIALFYLPVFCVCVLALTRYRPLSGAFLIHGVLGVATALVVSSPYWHAVYEMRQWVRFDAITSDAPAHVVHLAQLFSRDWGFGSSGPGPGDGMSFALGAPHVVVALGGALLGWRNGLIRTCFLLYLLLVYLTSTLAAWFWNVVPQLGIVQFPWRILSVTAVLQLVCAAGLGRLGRFRCPGKWSLAVFAVIFFGTLLWQRDQFRIKEPVNVADFLEAQDSQAQRDRIQSWAIHNEFLPKTVKIGPWGPRVGDQMLIAQPPTRVRPLPDNTAHHIHYEVTTDGEIGSVALQQFFLPGWRIEVNGVPLATDAIAESLTEDGLMVVAVPPNATSRIRAYYAGPPGWQMRLAVVVLWLLGVAVFLWRTQRVGRRTVT